MATVELGRTPRRARFTSKLRGNRMGLHIEDRFCPVDVPDPFETVDWEVRKAVIKDENGKPLFEQTDCEIPATWSQLATNVSGQQVLLRRTRHAATRKERAPTGASRLAHDDRLGTGRRLLRYASRWRTASIANSLGSACTNTVRSIHLYGFNVGLFQQYGVTGAKCTYHYNRDTDEIEQPDNPYEYPQGSACFIQSVEDNMEDIMRLAASEAKLFKFGSGTGTDLSTIRSSREKLSGGGTPSGPLSFMRVYDSIAGVIKSGWQDASRRQDAVAESFAP